MEAAKDLPNRPWTWGLAFRTQATSVDTAAWVPSLRLDTPSPGFISKTNGNAGIYIEGEIGPTFLKQRQLFTLFFFFSWGGCCEGPAFECN